MTPDQQRITDAESARDARQFQESLEAQAKRLREAKA